MSDKKPKKPQKLRARLPRGLVDRTPAEIAATRQMVETIRDVYERYGFEPVETPAMEYTDALGKFLPSSLQKSNFGFSRKRIFVFPATRRVQSQPFCSVFHTFLLFELVGSGWDFVG